MSLRCKVMMLLSFWCGLLLVSASAVGDAENAWAVRRTPIVAAFEANKDAVVNIASAQVRERRSDFFWGDFEDLFAPRRQVVQSLGSGFVIDPRGYVVTNAHVVERAVEIEVVLSDKQSYNADIVAVDAGRDLAVIKIDADVSLTTVKLGYSDDLMPGEPVLAIGNPFGYQHTVTDGIISAIHRELEVPGVELRDLIQISAPINPGNSGGPLLNILGEVIGINTAIRRAAQGIGFAIPIDQLRDALPEMLAVERLYRIDFGVEPEDLARQRHIDRRGPTEGVLIKRVREASIAAQAGLREGDVVVGIDDVPVRSLLDYSLALLEAAEEGREVAVLVRGDGQRRRIVRVAMAPKPKPDGAALAERLFGIRLHVVALQGVGGEDVQRLEVAAVPAGSTAAEADIEEGDIILGVNGARIQNLDELGLRLENVAPGERVRLTLERRRTRAGGWFVERRQFERTLRAQGAL